MLKVLFSLILVSISLAQTKVQIQVIKNGQLKNKKVPILCGLNSKNKAVPFVKVGRNYILATKRAKQLKKQLSRVTGSKLAKVESELFKVSQIAKKGPKACKKSRSLFSVVSSSYEVSDTDTLTLDLRTLNYDLPENSEFELSNNVDYISQIGSTLIITPSLSSESASVRYKAKIGELSSNEGVLDFSLVAGDEFSGRANSLNPYRDQVTSNEARHLLSKIGFGGEKALVDSIVANGLSASVDKLISECSLSNNQFKVIDNQAKALEAPLLDVARVQIGGVWYRANDYKVSTGLSKRTYLLHHFRNGSPLCGAMFTFFYNHFSTSMGDYLGNMHQANAADSFIDLIMSHMVGRYDILVSKMHADPLMIRWLNNAANTHFAPNENYGRELMELFMLGVTNVVSGERNYLESDVRPMTRAVSGFVRHEPRTPLIGYSDTGSQYSFDLWPRYTRFDLTRWMANPNDPDQITLFSGKPYSMTAPFIANSWVNLGTDFNHDTLTPAVLYNHPGAPVYLGAKLIGRFISPEASKPMIQEFSDFILQNGYDLKPILKKLLTSEAMFSNDNRHNSVKSPIEFVMSTIRSLDLPLSNTRANGGNRNNDLYKLVFERAASAGQNLLYYPSVFGVMERGVVRNGSIVDGADWISAPKLLMRERAITAYFNDLNLYVTNGDYAWSSLFSKISNPADPKNVVNYIADALAITLTDQERNAVVEFMTSVKLGTNESPQAYTWKVNDPGYVNLKMPTVVLMIAMTREGNLA